MGINIQSDKSLQIIHLRARTRFPLTQKLYSEVDVMGPYGDSRRKIGALLFRSPMSISQTSDVAADMRCSSFFIHDAP